MTSAVRARVLSVLAILAIVGSVASGLQTPSVAEAQGAFRPLVGCTANSLPRNDDSSTAAVPLGFALQFASNQYSSVFVNNNGNVTFGSPLSAYTPFGLRGDNHLIVAPF